MSRRLRPQGVLRASAEHPRLYGADYETGAERANALHKWLDGHTFFSATISTVRRDHIHQTVHETRRGCDHISFSAEYQVQRGATDNSDSADSRSLSEPQMAPAT